VWNLDGGTVFPDFTNPKSIDYWINQISNYHNILPFDGLWIVSTIFYILNKYYWSVFNSSFLILGHE